MPFLRAVADLLVHLLVDVDRLGPRRDAIPEVQPVQVVRYVSGRKAHVIVVDDDARSADVAAVNDDDRAEEDEVGIGVTLQREDAAVDGVEVDDGVTL